MPTFDLLLPPQSYSIWRPARPAASNRRLASPFRLFAR